MNGTPDIGHLVFEESAGKGKDTVDILCELQEKRVKVGVGADVGQKLSEERIDFSICEGKRWRYPSVIIVE